MKVWLDKYNDGGPIQPNYNDASVSMSDDFVGDGYSNVGRNYSPAWGGQFQKGGKLPMYVSDKNDPRLKAYKDSLDVRTKYDQTFKPGSKTRPLTKKEQQFWKDEETGLAPNLVEYDPKSGKNAGYFYFGHFKKPTQPVEYRPEPTPQSTIDWIEGNGYSEEYVPNVEQPKNANPFGIIEDPQTGYRHRYRTSTGELEMPFKGGQRYIQPKMAVGGSIPGAVGFTYARTEDIPSNGPYAKKTMASAQNGMEMKYYQEGLDWKPKSISRDGSVIKDDMGQYNHPGEITEIGSNQITMQGVPYPVLGISDTGDTQMMYPNQEYNYKGSSVTEYPMAQNGRNVAYVDSVLNANKNLNWVNRLYDVNRKSIMLPGEKDPSTHFMESGDGRVYPTVVEMPDGKLKHLGDKAYDYADSTNTFIQFPDDSTAQWFGKNYKQGTGVLKKKKQGGQLTKLDQLTNFTNYNTKQPGGWLDKYQ